MGTHKYTIQELRMKLCEKEKEADYRHQVAISCSNDWERMREKEVNIREEITKELFLDFKYYSDEKERLEKRISRLTRCNVGIFLVWLIQFLAYILK